MLALEFSLPWCNKKKSSLRAQTRAKEHVNGKIIELRNIKDLREGDTIGGSVPDS
jgi:hypothetical protein